MVPFANIFRRGLTFLKPVILPSYRVSLLCTVVKPKKKKKKKRFILELTFAR